MGKLWNFFTAVAIWLRIMAVLYSCGLWSGISASPHVKPFTTLQILTVIYRVVEACLKFAGQLGSLIEEVLKSTRAQRSVVAQTHKEILAAVQAMAGGSFSHKKSSYTWYSIISNHIKSICSAIAVASITPLAFRIESLLFFEYLLIENLWDLLRCMQMLPKGGGPSC